MAIDFISGHGLRKATKTKKVILLRKIFTLKIAHFLFFLFASSTNPAQAEPPHEFYVSVAELRFVPEKKELQITFTLFWDDWQRYLEDVKKLNPHLTYKDELPEATAILVDYLKQHFSINTDGKTRAYEFLGREYEVDVMHCYLLIKDVETFKSIALRNTFLTDYLPEQQNIMHLITPQGRKSVMTDVDNPNALLKF